ncbi:MAG: hypothetical protein J6X60_07495, partial [Ruminiclostridium sp.]|nr:hypothetical protein [Ruminiclostridium sp.]
MKFGDAVLHIDEFCKRVFSFCAILLSVLYVAYLRGAGLLAGTACPLRGDLARIALIEVLCQRTPLFSYL